MFLLVNQPTHAKMFQTSLLLKDLKGSWVNFFLVKPSRFGVKPPAANHGSLSTCNRPFQVLVLVYPTLVMEWRESCGEFLSRNRALVRTHGSLGHLFFDFDDGKNACGVSPRDSWSKSPRSLIPYGLSHIIFCCNVDP